MIIQGTSDGAAIILTRGEWSGHPDAANYYFATIQTGSLDVGQNVYAFDPTNEGLALFFAGLAEDWQGWDGVRQWSSLEGEFEVACEHDGLGHIGTTARLHKNRAYGVGWTGEIRFEISAGELDRIANELKKFFYND